MYKTEMQYKKSLEKIFQDCFLQKGRFSLQKDYNSFLFFKSSMREPGIQFFWAL
jgi:hypothetical protein